MTYSITTLKKAYRNGTLKDNPNCNMWLFDCIKQIVIIEDTVRAYNKTLSYGIGNKEHAKDLENSLLTMESLLKGTLDRL